MQRRPEYARIRLALAASVHFRDLPAATLDALAAAATIDRFENGGCVHRLGELPDRFWIVLEGSLMLYWVSASAVSVPVAIIGPGSFYSAASLVPGGTSSRTECRAEDDTSLAALAGADLRKLQAKDGAFRDLVPRLLLARFQASLAFYADSVSASLEQKLARRLLGQAMATAHDANGPDVEVRTTQSDLARMLGASRSKLNAELRRLEAAGVIRLGYRKLYLRDCEKLQAIAGGAVPVL